MTTYRVTYPKIYDATRYGVRDFKTRREAERFAAERKHSLTTRPELVRGPLVDVIANIQIEEVA